MCSNEELRGVLLEKWEIQRENYFMKATAVAGEASALPDGYRMEVHQTGPVTCIHIVAPDGDLAANGLAAETVDAFRLRPYRNSSESSAKGIGPRRYERAGDCEKVFHQPSASGGDGRWPQLV